MNETLINRTVDQLHAYYEDREMIGTCCTGTA